MSDTAETTRPLGRNYRTLFTASTLSNLGDGVGSIAYPWLASAVTRNPVLIALVAVAQRLPWLFMTLPAGVLADRMERARLMVLSNAFRTVLTVVVAVVVFTRQGDLPDADQLAAGIDLDTEVVAYAVLLLATLLLGSAEVIYDNAAQTIMPSLVHSEQLEKANGRLWSTEQVGNTVVGPLLGSALLAISFAVPFGFDAATFAISAILIATLPSAAERARALGRPVEQPAERDTSASATAAFKAEVSEGFGWLWRHDFLRPLAIILGLFNLIGSVGHATLVLYAQEVLGISATQFALLGTGGALGGLVGGWGASWVSERLGPGPSLWASIITGGGTTLIIGLTSNAIVVWAMFAVFMFFAVLWNVITVSLRQSVIPDALLGRVNSVYRFFAWGMIPIGALLGGVLIEVAQAAGLDRLDALRVPWIVAAALHVPLLAYAGPKLTTARIEAVRAEAGAGTARGDDTARNSGDESPTSA